jgi:hypothetical protein
VFCHQKQANIRREERKGNRISLDVISREIDLHQGISVSLPLRTIIWAWINQRRLNQNAALLQFPPDGVDVWSNFKQNEIRLSGDRNGI